MRHWTAEERKRQSELIRRWKPWKTAGVKTPEGKARSRMNAMKHGMYSAAAKSVSLFIRQCLRRVALLRAALRDRRGYLRAIDKYLKNNIPLPEVTFPNVERIIKEYGSASPTEALHGPPSGAF